LAEKAWLEARRVIAVNSLRQHLQDVQPRDDYREFARLALWLLGDDVDLDIGFSMPGAYHRARWMSKWIYCLQIFGFRSQIQLSRMEIDVLRRICLFICTVYVSFWFAAAQATAAPTNDLLMLQLIEDYKQVDSKVAAVAEKKLRLQLWYLSEDLVGLALFSDNVSDEDKGTIVNALQRDPYEEDVRRVVSNKIPQFRSLSVSDFVTRRSLNLFDALRLSQEFLTAPVDT